MPLPLPAIRNHRNHHGAPTSGGNTRSLRNTIPNMQELDKKYEQLGTLGHGAFSSVLLASPRPSAMISFGNQSDAAIKMFRCAGKACEALEDQGRSYDDRDADGAYASFAREIDALLLW